MTIQTQNIKEWNNYALECVFCSICIKHTQTRQWWNLDKRCPYSSLMSIRPTLFLFKQIQYGLVEVDQYIGLFLQKEANVLVYCRSNQFDTWQGNLSMISDKCKSHVLFQIIILDSQWRLHIRCLQLKYPRWRSLLANKKWGFGPCSIRKMQVSVAYALALPFETHSNRGMNLWNINTFAYYRFQSMHWYKSLWLYWVKCRSFIHSFCIGKTLAAPTI